MRNQLSLTGYVIPVCHLHVQEQNCNAPNGMENRKKPREVKCPSFQVGGQSYKITTIKNIIYTWQQCIPNVAPEANTKQNPKYRASLYVHVCTIINKVLHKNTHFTYIATITGVAMCTKQETPLPDTQHVASPEAELQKAFRTRLNP